MLTGGLIWQATVRDLYLRQDLGNYTESYTGSVPVHGVLALRITPLKCACRAHDTCSVRTHGAGCLCDCLHTACCASRAAGNSYAACMHTTDSL